MRDNKLIGYILGSVIFGAGLGQLIPKKPLFIIISLILLGLLLQFLNRGILEDNTNESNSEYKVIINKKVPKKVTLNTSTTHGGTK